MSEIGTNRRLEVGQSMSALPVTGRPVFFCRTVARSAVYPLAAISSTLIATTSQPRSLLSIARLNMARSRARPSIWSLVRIGQTCLGRNGGFAPVTLPLFQGTRLWGRGGRIHLILHGHTPRLQRRAACA